MDAFLESRPHPLGLTDHPEWEATQSRWEQLYLAERARLYPPAKPTLAERCAAWVRGFFA